MAATKADKRKLGVEATTMAIRESVMAYFKGTYVHSVVENTNVQCARLSQSMRGRRNYERVQIANQEQTMLFLGGTPLLLMQKVPDTLILYVDVFKRSPELREIRKELEQFLNTYLPGVIVEEHEGSVYYG